MGSKLELTLMGSPEVRLDGTLVAGFRSSKAQALLYYLAVTGQTHTRPALAGLLWGEWPENSARANLNQTLYNLRQLLGDHLVVTRQTAAFDQSSDYYLDLEALGTGNATLPQVVALVRGEFLEGFYVHDAPQFEEWLLRERVWVREQVLSIFHRLAMQHDARGEWAEAIEAARRMLALEPWREEAHRFLMHLLAQSGQRGAALVQYETCRRLLAEELGMAPSEETVALYQQIRSGNKVADSQRVLEDDQTQSSLRPLAPVPLYSLPVQTTPFVGREAELANVLGRLQDPACRLLTLAGPGGIGKTRLALQAALQLVKDPSSVGGFDDGACFVALTGVGSRDAMIATIAEASGLHFYHNQPPLQQLINYLREKRLLMVLDNFEHLLDEVDLLGPLLSAAPGLKLLVTSRVALNLQEEWFHVVAGMAVPPLEGEPDLERYDAVRLFAQSARRARLGFSLEAEQAHVARICRLVEGMPLAIELAAAWLKVLPAARVVEEIERNLDILSSRQLNVPGRHRSMRAVLEQTWQLLAAEEQDVLKQLAVFRGGFTQDAAAAVAGASLMVLATLVEKSLLRMDVNGHYQIHELTRQYAGEQLSAAPDAAQETHAHHCLYYLHFVRDKQDELTGGEQKTALRAVSQEVDNIRAAWTWAVEQGYIQEIEQASEALYQFCQISGRYQEGKEICTQALDRWGTGGERPGDAYLAGKLLARRGAFNLLLGDYEAANADLQAGLNIVANPGEKAFVLNALGRAAYMQGKRAAAEELLFESLAISRETGDLVGMAEVLHSLSNLYSSYADFSAGKQFASECLAISRQLERPHLVASALSALAWPVNCLGGYTESELYWRESLAICQESGDQGNTAVALNYIGWVAWCIGGTKLRQAITYAEQALAIYRQIGHRTHVASCLGDLALFSIDLGNYEQALRYGREGLATAQAIGHFDLVPYNLYVLAAAACGAGDFTTSRQYLFRSMVLSLERRVPDFAVMGLFYFAALITAECKQIDETDLERFRKQVRALHLLTTAIESPATWQPIRDRANRLRRQILALLPAEVGEQAQRHRQDCAWDEVVAEVVAEFDSYLEN